MKRGTAAILTLALWSIPGPALAGWAPESGESQGSLARIRTAQLPKAYSAGSAAVGDLNGDGREDLVVSGVLRDDGRERALFLFHADAEGELGAGEMFELKLDVTAWALSDVHADAGEECVLFTARGAFVMRSRAEEAERFALLAATDFLWQLPDGEAAFLWDRGLLDLDGDGLDDLLFPQAGSYAVSFQTRANGAAAFTVPGRLPLPHEPRPSGAYVSASGGQASWRGQRSEAQLGLSQSVSAGVDDDYSLPAILLTVHETVPAPQVLDWDGDGDLDLLAQTETRLHVWIQDQREFAVRHSFTLPVEADRDRRLDASYSSHAVDLNADSRADCVIFAGDNKKKDVRTQALVYVQGSGRGEGAQTAEAPLFGPRGRPQDLLVFAGFVVRPDFVDVDGDGRTDLIISGVRPDLIDQLRSISSESIDADLFVYLNQGTNFSRRPDLAYKLNVPLEQFEPTARFIGDVSGDGVSELLLRDEPGAIRLFMVRAPRGEGEFTVIERPLWELKVRDNAVLALQVPEGRALPDLLVIERTQVHQVRFR